MQSTEDITLHDDGEFIWEITAFLRVAAGLTAVLSRPRKQGIIHKNIKLGNILVKTACGEAWLTGFGISSRLARERQPSQPPELIAAFDRVISDGTPALILVSGYSGIGKSLVVNERQRALRRGTPFELELRARRKDGAYRWLDNGRPRQQRNLAWR